MVDEVLKISKTFNIDAKFTPVQFGRTGSKRFKMDAKLTLTEQLRRTGWADLEKIISFALNK